MHTKVFYHIFKITILKFLFYSLFLFYILFVYFSPTYINKKYIHESDI